MPYTVCILYKALTLGRLCTLGPRALYRIRTYNVVAMIYLLLTLVQGNLNSLLITALSSSKEHVDKENSV